MNPRRTVTFFVFGLWLVACGGPPPARSAKPIPSSAASTASVAPAPTTTTSPAVDAPIELRVWTRYVDFSGHGFNGSGEFYRHAGSGGWESAHCQVSHVADPQAGDGNQPPACTAWAPAPKEKWPVLDKLKASSTEIECARAAASCAELGLVAEPMR